ncbi:hypothetical protein AAZX31_07G059300 [Glycine max]|uniref:Uncharacterized protein n=2 Tax=Glycine subgen. Soja TaxID=1462606 RepID=I1KI10_SOYBN|nr:hypothetical protein JHK82_017691 [Glycine max]KAH1085657.1 hypothetical protein GYH30_017565 [Glycine max]KRH47993.1 hypothetical protein GLYMA_07G061200v4 [Glycine max]RZC01658.1 hypothetical protein D0Y65_017045 [Glycine soja]
MIFENRLAATILSETNIFYFHIVMESAVTYKKNYPVGIKNVIRKLYLSIISWNVNDHNKIETSTTTHQYKPQIIYMSCFHGCRCYVSHPLFICLSFLCFIFLISMTSFCNFCLAYFLVLISLLFLGVYPLGMKLIIIFLRTYVVNRMSQVFPKRREQLLHSCF